MGLYKKIMLISGTEINWSVIKQISAVAEPKGAELKLLRFSDTHFEPQSRPIVMPMNQRSIFRDYRLNDSDASKLIDKFKMRALLKKFNGYSQQTINSEIERDQHDLIVVDTSQGIAMLTHRFTTLAMHLLRSCPLPLLIHRPTETSGRMRIMAAVDPLNKPYVIQACQC